MEGSWWKKSGVSSSLMGIRMGEGQLLFGGELSAQFAEVEAPEQ